MPYPYKKMDEQDFAYIRSVTAPSRVWVGEAIAKEFYHDEMPERTISSVASQAVTFPVGSGTFFALSITL